MKPIVHHFHAQPPHHGARYYFTLATCLVVSGVVYAVWALLR